MTLSFELGSEEEVKNLSIYLKQFYDYLELSDEAFPGVVETYNDRIDIHMTDKFFKYSYQFFMSTFILSLGIETRRRYLENLSYEFRKGAEEFLMSSIILK